MTLADFKSKAWKAVAAAIAALITGLASAQQCAANHSCESGIALDKLGNDCLTLKAK